jgi:aldose 1-epimerase
MSFTITTRTQPGVANRDATIYTLAGPEQVAEVWPALGFNCFSWKITESGRSLDLLYSDPVLFGDGRPTRSGIPVLFPFPNRIRDGRFTWDGKTYQLPLNDPAGKNAIHGFACRHPWRVVDQGADHNSAWLTGQFRGSLDAPEDRALWPADYQLTLTIRLGDNSLRLEAEVFNPDTKPLPFGLGYHPYFKLPFAPNGDAADYLVQVPARSYWPLTDSLPNGDIRPVDAPRDLTTPRRYGDLKLDDVLTAVSTSSGADGLRECGAIQGDSRHALRLSSSTAFRDLVVFTPPHRQAFCIEPYTCTTDAINLQARGVDAGWLTLAPGQRWSEVVEMRPG